MRPAPNQGCSVALIPSTTSAGCYSRGNPLAGWAMCGTLASCVRHKGRCVVVRRVPEGHDHQRKLGDVKRLHARTSQGGL